MPPGLAPQFIILAGTSVILAALAWPVRRGLSLCASLCAVICTVAMAGEFSRGGPPQGFDILRMLPVSLVSILVGVGGLAQPPRSAQGVALALSLLAAGFAVGVLGKFGLFGEW